MRGVIHVWTAPVEQEVLTAFCDGQGHSCVRPIARGARPLAMMVSVDRSLIKLARFNAR
jgi:predicted methyltransferase